MPNFNNSIFKLQPEASIFKPESILESPKITFYQPKKEARYTSLGSKISDTSTSSEENLTDDSRSNHAISPTPNNSSPNPLEPGMQASYS